MKIVIIGGTAQCGKSEVLRKMQSLARGNVRFFPTPFSYATFIDICGLADINCDHTKSHQQLSRCYQYMCRVFMHYSNVQAELEALEASDGVAFVEGAPCDFFLAYLPTHFMLARQFTYNDFHTLMNMFRQLHYASSVWCDAVYVSLKTPVEKCAARLANVSVETSNASAAVPTGLSTHADTMNASFNRFMKMLTSYHVHQVCDVMSERLLSVNERDAVANAEKILGTLCPRVPNFSFSQQKQRRRSARLRQHDQSEYVEYGTIMGSVMV